MASLIAVALAAFGPIVEPVEAASPPIRCRPCLSPRNVIFMIGLPSQDDHVQLLTRLWIEKHSLAARNSSTQRIADTMQLIVRFPGNLSEFRNEIQKLADGCMRIATLGIISHGNAGYLLIGSDGISIDNLDDAFGNGLSCAMAPDASVDIGGCNVGRGCSGANFMVAAATRLLRAGGRILAPESYVYGNAWLRIAPQSIFGDRVLQVSAGGSQSRWIQGAEGSASCAAQFRAAAVP